MTEFSFLGGTINLSLKPNASYSQKRRITEFKTVHKSLMVVIRLIVKQMSIPMSPLENFLVKTLFTSYI